MTLGFPNPSRSFDAERNAVRFTGHDGMFEVAFYVETAALPRSGSARDVPASEAEYLAAFDAARSKILDAARAAYAGPRRPNYMLTSAQFR